MQPQIAGVGQTVAAGENPGRKVRAPQGRTLGNTQEGRPSDSATESKPPDPGRVRVKRWCKRPPDAAVTRHARHTPFGARPNREGGRPGRSLPGRLLEGAGNCTPRGMTVTRGQPCGQNPAYSPTPAYSQPRGQPCQTLPSPPGDSPQNRGPYFWPPGKAVALLPFLAGLPSSFCTGKTCPCIGTLPGP